MSQFLTSQRTAAALAAAILFSLVSQPTFSQDGMNNWPSWRGPNLNGVSENATPPLKWSESENLKWKVAVPGKGSATPVVWDNQIFVSTAVPKKGDTESDNSATPPANARGGGRGRGSAGPSTAYDFTVCSFQLQTGELLWKTVVHSAVPHESGHNTNTFASASPITDGKHVFASFGSNGIYCLDMKGNLIWSKMLGQMRTRNSFGEGASPALHKDILVVPWDHEGQSFIVALDTRDGSEKWRVDRDEPTTWATPLITEYQGTTQVITNGTNRVRSYDLSNGELIWECAGQVSNPIPTPIRDGDYVLVMTGYRGFAIQSIALDAKGDVTDTDKVRWVRNDAAPYVSSAVLYKGTLYLTKSRDAILSAVKADDGEVIIDQERLPQLDGLYASLAAANDHVFAVGRNGTTSVIKHSPTFEVVSSNRLDEGIDASPVFIGKTLLLRGAAHLYCLEATAAE